MEADIHVLYQSDFYRVLDFRCRCINCKTSEPEYSEAFCISFVRKGNFLFNVFRHSLDSYTGCVLVSKPGYERTVTHVHTVPDECTIFEFIPDFYQKVLQQYPAIKFLHNNDLHSTLVKVSPETELLHYQAVRGVLDKTAGKLELDNLVMDLIETVFGKITDYKPDFDVYNRMKKHHLITVERARDYIVEKFSRDISLMELADHCSVSPFHFSRIFKTLTRYTPHQFLRHTRLKNAEILLKNTALPVADVAFASGFNSVEHFTAAFSNRYRCAPATYRNLKKSSRFSQVG